VKGKILFCLLPLLGGAKNLSPSGDISAVLEGVSSGYFLKVRLDKKEEEGTLLFFFDGEEIGSTYVGEEDSSEKTFSLDNSSDRLVYSGERPLSFRFVYLSGESFEKDYLLSGIEGLPSYAEGNALIFPALKDGDGKGVSFWNFALEDPYEYVPPDDVPFVLSDYLSISVPEFLEGNAEYRLYLGSSSYPLEARTVSRESGNVLLSLSGKTAFLNGEEADSVRVLVSCKIFSESKFTLSLPFLSREAFKEGGWSYAFGIFDE
jgi:hypothetical protein